MCTFTNLAVRSDNEIEKRKIMESNKYQHPETIKQCLGDTLGGIVINLIPKDELLWWTENDKVPLHFELKPKNMLSGDIKLTPVDNDENTKTLYLNIIKRKFIFVLNRVINVYCTLILYSRWRTSQEAS